MNRRKFFNRAAMGVGVAIAAPTILGGMPALTLPKLTLPSAVPWDLIDEYGVAFRKEQELFRGRYNEGGSVALRESLKLYIAAKGHPIEVVPSYDNSSEPYKIPTTRRLNHRFEYEKHHDNPVDIWRSLVTHAGTDMIQLGDDIRMDGQCKLYMAALTPLVLCPETFEPHSYVLIRYFRKIPY